MLIHSANMDDTGLSLAVACSHYASFSLDFFGSINQNLKNNIEKCCCFFLHCLSICKLLLLFFLHCLSICKLLLLFFLHCLSICKLLLLFFLHCLEHCKCSSAVFCTVCPYVNCLLFFCTVCPYVNCLLFFWTVCPYVNCLLFFCTVWSTLIRISLTKALVLWWCDNKSDLIWFDLKRTVLIEQEVMLARGSQYHMFICSSDEVVCCPAGPAICPLCCNPLLNLSIMEQWNCACQQGLGPRALDQ